MIVKWQEQVKQSTTKHIIAQVPRQSGKTITGLEWARTRYTEEVIYVVANVEQARRLATFMGELYEGEVSLIQSASYGANVGFKDRTHIRFMSCKQVEYPGLRCAYVVVDDAQFLINDYATLDTTRIKQALYLGTKLCDAAQKLLSYEDVMGGCELIVHDYLDLLGEGYYSPSTIRKIMGFSTDEYFAMEFGPWEKPEVKENEDFLQLLNPVL